MCSSSETFPFLEYKNRSQKIEYDSNVYELFLFLFLVKHFVDIIFRLDTNGGAISHLHRISILSKKIDRTKCEKKMVYDYGCV